MCKVVCHGYRAITLVFIVNAFWNSVFNEEHCSSAEMNAVVVGELTIAACIVSEDRSVDCWQWAAVGYDPRPFAWSKKVPEAWKDEEAAGLAGRGFPWHRAGSFRPAVCWGVPSQPPRRGRRREVRGSPARPSSLWAAAGSWGLWPQWASSSAQGATRTCPNGLLYVNSMWHGSHAEWKLLSVTFNGQGQGGNECLQFQW